MRGRLSFDTEDELIAEALRLCALNAGRRVDGPADLAPALCMRARGWRDERYTVAGLNDDNTLIRFKTVFRGTRDWMTLAGRPIARALLKMNAARAVTSHNHVEPPCRFSDEDVRTAMNVSDMLKPLGIDLADEILTCGDEWKSMRETTGPDTAARMGLAGFPRRKTSPQPNGTEAAAYVFMTADDMVKCALSRCEVRAGQKLRSPKQFADFLRLRRKDADEEVLSAVWLTAAMRVIAVDEWSSGSLTRVKIHPRILVKRGIDRNAAGIVLAHNHLGGEAKPGEADILFTREAAERLGWFEIALHDHLVVSGSKWASMASDPEIRKRAGLNPSDSLENSW